MSGLKTQIEIGADASGVEAGVNDVKRKLAGLGQAAQAAGKAGSDGLAQIGTGADTSAKSVERATKSIVSQIKRAQLDIATAGKSMSESLEIKANFKGIDPAVIAPYIAQLKEAEKAQLAMSQSMGNMGISAKQTAAAMRGVPAQMTDIITSLQGGQAPMTVLLQQGGQLKDMFGGVGNAARAMGGYLAGIVTNPLVLAAAAVGALGYAAYSAAKDARDLRDAVILTGGAAGASADQLLGMSRQVGVNTDALNAFARSGAVTADNIESITRAAIKFENIGGAAVAETVKAFEQLKRSPVEASIALNEKTNYLTKSLYDQIKALEDQGRHLDAVALAEKSYGDALSKMGAEADRNLGSVARWWKAVKEGAEAATDSAKNFVGTTPLDAKATSAAQKAVSAQAAYDFAFKQQNKFGPDGADTAYLAALKKVVDETAAAYRALDKARQGDTASAAENAKQNEKTKAAIAYQQQIDATRSNAEKRTLEIESNRNRGAAGGIDAKDIAHQESLINQKYDTGASIAAVKQAEDTKLAYIARAQDQINTLRATGNLTEIGAIQATTEQTLKAIDVRRNALLAERAIVAGRQDSEKEVVALDTQIAALSQQRLTAKAEGENKVTVALYARTEAIRAVQDAERQSRTDDETAAVLRQAAARDAITYALQDQADALKYADQQIALEGKLVGATNQARTLAIAQLRIELDLKKQIDKIDNTHYDDGEVGREAERARARKQAAEAAAQAETQITVQYWTAAVASIQESLTDGIINGIENDGVQGAIRGVRDAFVHEFENLVLRPIINAYMAPVAQGVAGLFGITPQGSPANGLSAGGVLNTASTANSLYSSGSSLYTVGSQYFGGTMSGANAVGTIGANATGTGIDGLLASNGAYGTAAGSSGGTAAGASAGTYSSLGIAGLVLYGMHLLATRGGEYVHATGSADSNFNRDGTITGGSGATGFFAQTNDKTIVGPDGQSHTTSTPTQFGTSGQDNSVAEQAVKDANAAYINATKLLGIKATDSHFTFNSNNSDGGKFALTADAGGKSFNSGEVALNDNALKLAAGRAVITALEGSDLPAWMSGVFDKLDASTLDQAGVDNTIKAAADLKGAYDVLATIPGADLTNISYDTLNSIKGVSGELAAVDIAFSGLGYTLLDISAAGGAAAQGLIAAFGGLQNFAAQTSALFENYYTQDEQRQHAYQSVVTILNAAGIADYSATDIAGASREQIRAVLDQYAGKKGTTEGDKQYAAVVAGANALNPYVAGFADPKKKDAPPPPPPPQAPAGFSGGSSGGGSADMSSALSVWKRAADAIVATMADLQKTLVDSDPDSYAKLQAQFFIKLAQDKAGDITATQALPELAKSLVEAGKNSTKSALEQAQLTARVLASLGDSATAAAARAAAESHASAGGGNSASFSQSAYGLPYEDKTLAWLTSQNTSGNAVDSFPGYEYKGGRWQPVGTPDFGSVLADGSGDIYIDPETGAMRLHKKGDSAPNMRVPAFASGGAHSGGWAMVGEQGPELAYMPPARIYNAADTRALMGGGSDGKVAAALDALAARLDAIEANTRAGAQHGGAVSRILTRMTPGGDAIATREAAAL